MSSVRRVDLGIDGLWIWQDIHAQPVSIASHILYHSVLDAYGSETLKLLELGSGCGIVSIMLALNRPLWRIEGVEIQESLCSMSLSNAAQCAADVRFHKADLRSFICEASYDLIVSNPPWMPQDSGKLSPFESRNISRFELVCSMQDVLSCIKRNLSDCGEAFLLYPESRLDDLKRVAAETFLDINSITSATGIKEHMICRLRHQGHN